MNTSINEKNACISIYTTHQATEHALGKLQTHGLSLRHVSILARGCLDVDHPIGIYTIDDRIHYCGLQAEFWAGLHNLLDKASFFWLPGYGPLAAVGHIVDLLLSDRQYITLHGGFSVLGSALFEMGVPRDSIVDYEQAIRSGRLLLIVHNGRDPVELACKILHSENQQVTVHYA